MTADDEYSERAKRLLRTEMVRRAVSYEALAEKLTAIGLPETAVNLRNKVSRGKFTAAFMLAVCDALDISTISTRAP